MPNIRLTTEWVLIVVSALLGVFTALNVRLERAKNRRLQASEKRLQSEADSAKRIELESRKLLGVGRAPTEADFLNMIRPKLHGAASIKILSHTGKRIVAPVKVMLEAQESRYSQGHPLRLNVLLKDPFSEHEDRRARIALSCEELLQLASQRDDIHVDIRFYSGIQVLRGVFVDYRDSGERDCLASNYGWVPNSSNDGSQAAVTRALSGGFVWTGQRGAELDFMKVVENWFDYYWGPGLIHTVAFDFDDTLLRTYDDHIAAWEGAVMQFAKDASFRVFFSPALLDLLRAGESIKPHLEAKFIECQDAEELASSLLSVEGDRSGFAKKLNRARYALRRSPFESSDKNALARNVRAREIRGARSALSKLRETGYPLFVASLTDEAIITPCLKVMSVAGLFSGILGRADYDLRSFDGVPAKTYLLSKVCALAGVPPYRLLFIGDHRNDLEAARNVGAVFIEARVVGPNSHVATLPGEDHLWFADFDDLVARVGEAEALTSRRMERQVADVIRAVHGLREEATAKL